ncbi:MAG: ADP-forming succinate--CoA ligase subunit beta [Candidatus Parabeggiatoa sp. nov. 3]|nr:MAG: ADP-forming succinate--CoA ligase subunit beta [Gammaproteobacteria bacterium]RKZ63202.1 MAG: ADP-forming succinate--CoA ligase subunit beta [Gammaproteobacteria bacterium]RKZ89225.1 MAG: ADP-forming succinate--CoA ligase subunit beta [Gammaproteobacteria bacterium]
MNIHEYQAKQLFAKYTIPVPAGQVARNELEAKQHAADLGGQAWMVKTQVHAGGRGKAGGVQRAQSLEEVTAITQSLIGSRLKTHQTGPDGQPVHCVLIEKTTNIKSELYLSLVVDRATARLAVMASRAGGMDIEEISATAPEKIIRRTFDPLVGIQAYECREIGFALDLNTQQVKQLTAILFSLYRLFVENDLSLVEINPLIITDQDELMALDAKINIDDNALYRHSDLAALYDSTQEDEKEHQARQFDLNYVALDGDIACMVNGAGLAMATMDVIKIHGAEPANFLDVGGGTTAERVTQAFKIILSDPKVKSILVNIFGGIVRCDLIAEGVIHAIKETGTTVPVVVRLEGTHVDKGKALLKESGLSVISAIDLDDAAKKAVSSYKG